MVEALRTRTFNVVPRVNPDGVEAALATRPSHHRSSIRPWLYKDGYRWSGLNPEDVDGDGRILTMRIVDPDGGWVEHPEEGRVMEFWDAVHHATGIKSSTDVWFFGPTVEQELAVCRWSDEHAPGSYVRTLVRIQPSAAQSGRDWRGRCIPDLGECTPVTTTG